MGERVKMKQNIWKRDWYNVINKPSKVTNQCLAIMKVLKKKPKMFFDVGPGRFGSEAWEIVNNYPECKIIGFEPQIERYDMLLKHKFPGKLLNCVISKYVDDVKGFMGYADGKSDFWLYGGDSVLGAYKEETVRSFTLDYINENDGPFDSIFIWADVEGSELSVLEGAKNILSKKTVIGLNLELRKIPIAPGACSAQEVVSFLKEYGYYSTENLDSLKSDPKDYIFIQEEED